MGRLISISKLWKGNHEKWREAYFWTTPNLFSLSGSQTLLSLSLSLSLYRTLARSSPPLSHAFALNASLLSYFLVCDFYFFAHSASDLMCVVDISSWSIHSGFRVGFLLAPVNSLNFCLQGFNMVLENNPPCWHATVASSNHLVIVFHCIPKDWHMGAVKSFGGHLTN